MKIVGMMRCHNEGRWLAEVLRSIHQLTEEIYFLDDHSTDDTREIAAANGATVIRSPYPEDLLDESRDKNLLLDHVIAAKPDYVIALDGDEVLQAGAREKILPHLKPQHSLYSFPIKYLWDDRDHYRADGVYGRFYQYRMFSLVNQSKKVNFGETSAGGNFHCGSSPRGLVGSGCMVKCDILHLGYMDAEDRLRKYHWYRQKDPNNPLEDNYRHIAQGLLPELPANQKFLHGGPLKVFTLGPGKWERSTDSTETDESEAGVIQG